MDATALRRGGAATAKTPVAVALCRAIAAGPAGWGLLASHRGDG